MDSGTASRRAALTITRVRGTFVSLEPGACTFGRTAVMEIRVHRTPATQVMVLAGVHRSSVMTETMIRTTPVFLTSADACTPTLSARLLSIAVFETSAIPTACV